MADNRFVIQCVIGNTVKVIAVVTGIAPHCVCVLCVQVFHSLFWPLEFTLPNRDNNKCYAKIICNKLDNVRLLLLKHCCIISEPLATSAIPLCYMNDDIVLFLSHCRIESLVSTIWVQMLERWRRDSGQLWNVGQPRSSWMARLASTQPVLR